MGTDNKGSTNSSINTSADGTRPSTSAGTDNLGAASGFTPGKSTSGGSAAPAPRETMTLKRQNHRSDSATDPGPHSEDRMAPSARTTPGD